MIKRQYGVQVVWKDPVASGAITLEQQMDPEFVYEPRWAVFDSKEQADRHASSYRSTLGEMAERMPWLTQSEQFDPEEVWMANGVKEVNRAERDASEVYGPWE